MGANLDMHAQTDAALSRPEETSRAAPVRPVERLSIRSLCKSWDRARDPVLNGVDLALESGTLASLVGANGAGKTTLLRIVAGLISPDSGTVTVDGLEPGSGRREYQRRIGFLPAGQTGLYARFTVRSHLEYWARIAFVARRRRAGAVERMLEGFALGEIASRRADRISMGQRQRVRLAMTFLHEPRLVLLDEPRNSLDSTGRALLGEALTTFVHNGGTAIWCAPTVDEIDLAVARPLTLADGRLSAG